jgi:hypothetical protein
VFVSGGQRDVDKGLTDLRSTVAELLALAGVRLLLACAPEVLANAAGNGAESTSFSPRGMLYERYPHASAIAPDNRQTLGATKVPPQ